MFSLPAANASAQAASHDGFPSGSNSDHLPRCRPAASGRAAVPFWRSNPGVRKRTLNQRVFQRIDGMFGRRYGWEKRPRRGWPWPHYGSPGWANRYAGA